MKFTLNPLFVLAVFGALTAVGTLTSYPFSAADAQRTATKAASPRVPPSPDSRAARGAPVPRPCPDQVPDDMACVTGGQFRRGSENGFKDEKPTAEVYVETFLMDKYEVTNEKYEACIQAGLCNRPIRFRGYMAAKQPMVGISWFDAVAHCKMNGKRLPTEAEWERAASGPHTNRYPWGDDPLGCERAVIETADGKGCGRGTTWPVGSKPVGHFGLYDMAGNVWEWVADWYSPCYQGCEEECGQECLGTNPKGPCSGALKCPGRNGLRVVRGGSWWYPQERARASARRGSGAPNRGPHRFGFRCARDL